MSRSTPETCPNCGADVPPGAKACPECGSDEGTGWSDEAYASTLGLPDDSFDYQEFTEREFGTGKPKRKRMRWVWWVVAISLLVAFVALALHRK
jgi:uncharacterized membrane protein YvbJ